MRGHPGCDQARPNGFAKGAHARLTNVADRRKPANLRRLIEDGGDLTDPAGEARRGQLTFSHDRTDRAVALSKVITPVSNLASPVQGLDNLFGAKGDQHA